METHTVITEKKERASYTDLFLRTVAVIGLVAVLILGAWGIIQLAIAIPNLFSGGGSGTVNTNAQKTSLVVSSAAAITAGQTLQVSWTLKNTDTAQYSYALSYACQSGLSIGVPMPNGAYQQVACNTPFNYVQATQRMSVIPTLSGTASVPLVFTVTATKLSTGIIAATGTSTTMVAPSAAAVKPAVSKPAATAKPASPAYYPAATRPALFGYPDLAVTVNSVTPNSTRTTVQFTIANTGTNIVNSGWTFNASLPINGSYTFASQAQQALYPGDKIVYSLSFDNTYGTNQYQNNPYGYSTATSYPAGGYTCTGYNCTVTNNVCVNGSCNTGYNYPTYPTNQYGIGTVSVTADPQNYIVELNKGNNYASATTPIY